MIRQVGIVLNTNAVLGLGQNWWRPCTPSCLLVLHRLANAGHQEASNMLQTERAIPLMPAVSTEPASCVNTDVVQTSIRITHLAASSLFILDCPAVTNASKSSVGMRSTPAAISWASDSIRNEQLRKRGNMRAIAVRHNPAQAGACKTNKQKKKSIF